MKLVVSVEKIQKISAEEMLEFEKALEKVRCAEISFSARTWSERIHGFLQLIWAGWVFLVNGDVLLEFPREPGDEKGGF